jgi:tetratricopeptide (TPR) repeat protein
MTVFSAFRSGLAPIALAFFLTPFAAAQITPKTLVGDAVPDIANRAGPQEHLRDAITRIQLGKVSEAYEFCKDARKALVSLPPAEVIMARLFAAFQSPTQTRLWLERAVAEDPDDPEAFVLFGESAIREGRVTDAELLFTKALGLAEKYKGNDKRKRDITLRALQGRAGVAERREKWSEAQADLTQWIKADLENAVPYQRLGQALFFQERYPDSERVFKKADELDAKSGKNELTAWEVTMGQLYERKAQSPKTSEADRKALRAKAAEKMDAAVTRLPKDVNVRLGIASWAMQTNQIEVAERHAEEAVKLDPTSLPAKVIRGYVARLKGDQRKAEEMFELAHLQSPSDFSTSNNLALALIEAPDDRRPAKPDELHPKHSRAMQFAAMNVQRFPVNGNSPFRFEAASSYGWILYKLGRTNEAGSVLQAVLQGGQLSQDSAYYVAQILFDLGRYDDAGKLLANRVESDAPFVHRADAKKLLDDIEKRAKKP